MKIGPSKIVPSAASTPLCCGRPAGLSQFFRFAGKVLPLAALCCAVAACSGGGGSDDDDGGDDGDGPSTDACGDLGLKVIDGTSCSTGGSPVVELTIFELDGSASACSGTLIDPSHVLTAGHCFSSNGAFTVRIDVGFGSQTVVASDFAIHPDYFEDNTNQAVFNDVAVITVAAPSDVAPIPLLLSRAPQVGDIFDIFGYGLDEDGELGTLKSGQMEVDQVTSNHIFSNFDGEGSNTCQGDSGGPAIMVLNGTPALIGVTSSGTADAACQVGDLSLFANVQDSSILNFIVSRASGAGAI